MNIISAEFVGVTIQTIYLHLSDTWLSGMYKGSTFIGVCWDFKAVNSKVLFNAANELFPSDINDLERFEKEFGDRVTYHPTTDKDYYDLSGVNLEDLKIE